MSGDVLPHPRRFRDGLLALAAVPVIQSAWMLLAPQGFYDSFPGLGRAWLPAVGVYDEHLSRDVGAAQLGMAVVLIGAALVRERRLVQVALLGFLAGTLPHFAFHVTTIGSYGAVDNLLSLGGFAAQMLFAAWLLLQTRSATTTTTRSAPWPASTPSRPPRAVH